MIGESTIFGIYLFIKEKPDVLPGLSPDVPATALPLGFWKEVHPLMNYYTVEKTM